MLQLCVLGHIWLSCRAGATITPELRGKAVTSHCPHPLAEVSVDLEASWSHSPFAASVLGSLDCKKAAISLSSSLSLWRRIFPCSLFAEHVVLRFLTPL